MAKVPPKSGVRRGPGPRRREGDPLGGLSKIASAWTAARTTPEREVRSREIEAYVGKLSSSERQQLRRDYWKLALKRQKEIHKALRWDTDTVRGPVAPLLNEILEDRRARVSALPETTDGSPSVAPGDLVELFPDLHLAEAERMAADMARNRKSAAVNRAVEPAALAEADRRKEDRLRPMVKEAMGLAARLVNDAARLAELNRNISLSRSSLGRFRIAAVRRAHSGQGSGELAWKDVEAFSDLLLDVAEGSEKLLGEMRGLDEELKRAPGGQRNHGARGAAAALKKHGLTLRQTTEVLARNRVVPDWYTAEHLRDLEKKDRQKAKAKTPGKG